jgi:hypothetical protein
LAIEEESLLQLAAAHFVMAEEDSNGYPAAFQQQKIEGWRNDPEAIAFFLQRLVHAKSVSPLPSADTIRTYLRKTQDQLLRMNPDSGKKNSAD